MPSFDIVSEVNTTDVRHAVENAARELETRFDFRGVDASFEWQKDHAVVKAEADFQLNQMLDILRSNLTRQKVDNKTMDIGNAVHAGKTFSQIIKFKEGIESEMAKKLVKHIKDSKIKVQASIQGEQVRVTGKNRDDLQAVMALVREANLGQPFQFNNFRDWTIKAKRMDTHSAQQELLSQTAKANWQELERFFAAGKLIFVASDLNLIDVGTSLIGDDTASFAKWTQEQRVYPVSDPQAALWQQNNTILWTSVVAPWVLVQELKEE